ncbi:MAG TPA: hypothetical protein VGR03_12300 [Candidatus Acidoferrum sp.]|nr:hypothetical protein [Candidatus Acidoferrum sp.]
MRHLFRLFTSLLVALCVSLPAPSIDAPLSDQAVREAYFLGQRHEGSYTSLLGNYIKRLPAPKSGPHISSVTLLTPFIQLVANSDRFIGNYSAQQALLDHRGQEESVKITVEIYLTNSYGPLIANPANSQSRSSSAFMPRPYDFWRDFRVQVYDGNRILSPSASGGHPLYRCGRTGQCRPMGAALELEFPANSFPSDTISVYVTPPEGDPVSVDFDLTRLR